MSGSNSGETGVAPDELRQRLLRLEEASLRAERQIQVQTDETRKEGEDRSWIARTILWGFLGALVMAFLLLAGRGLHGGEWEAASRDALELMKSVLLPIVTLVLGYYFGRGSARS